MRTFAGFPEGKTSFTPIPDLFFTEVLCANENAAELKLTLYMFWALNRQRGYPRYMMVSELENETLLLSALAADSSEEPGILLHRALQSAVERGVLLLLTIAAEEGDAGYVFINTPQGRKAIEQVKSGDLILEVRGPVREAHIARERPNIFGLYEQNIGLLQPLLAEELELAARTYPPEWIEDAFKIAVESNARSWRYIRAVLERWTNEGRDDDAGPHSRRATRSGARQRGCTP
ncbi:MAG: DnaD domain-containing protein [Anaerolineae bacterium]